MSKGENIEEKALGVFRHLAMRFSGHGYRLYLVGGSVRDLCLKRDIHDLDMTTDALPQSMYQLLTEWGYAPHKEGIAYGTVGLVLGEYDCEITTMRFEGDYDDGRHPKDVAFTKELELDLRRRDFTINAMALNLEGELIDPFRGQEDLKNRRLKTVGDPEKRFAEDGLRLLRAVRMKSTFALDYDQELKMAMEKMKNQLLCLPVERVRQEFEKSFKGEGGLTAIIEIFESGFFQVLHPDVQCEFKVWFSWLREVESHQGWRTISEEHRKELGWILMGAMCSSDEQRKTVYQVYGCSKKRIEVWCAFQEKLDALNQLSLDEWESLLKCSENNQNQMREQWLNCLASVSSKERLLWVDLIGLSASSHMYSEGVLRVKKSLNDLMAHYPIDWQNIKVDPFELEKLKARFVGQKCFGQALNALKLDKRQELWKKDMEKEIRETYNGKGTTGK